MSKHYILFDDEQREDLYPFTFSRACSEIRWGILTLREKWEKRLNETIGVKTVAYLQDLYGSSEGEVRINSRLLPSEPLINAISELGSNTRLLKSGKVLIEKGNEPFSEVEFEHEVSFLEKPWQIFQQNHREIEEDFKLITYARLSQPLSETNKVIGANPIFLEEGAKAECSIFNTTDGPIYIGKNAEVQEGCMIRGPFSLGESSQLKMGARIYTGTTIGPHCKVGGEVNNSVIFGFSNKAHEGFLGNSVIGEWCNLGADTNNSNLKNNYAEVKVWSFSQKRFVNTGLQFCGLIMGDHSKSGINTMFNTGTVVGFSSNIFGSGFPRTIIPSFGWGGAAGMETYSVNKALETAEKVFARRGLMLDEVQRNVFKQIFELTADSRA